MKKYNPYPSKTGLLTVLLLGAAWGLSAQTLTHRYSFQDTAGSATFADSVGSSPGTLVGNAQLDGTELVLDGQNSDYATLPTGLVSNYTQITVEFWADLGTTTPNTVWTRVFAFGDQNGSGNKNSGYDYCHYAGGNYQNEDVLTTNGVDSYANSTPGLDGTINSHVTVVVDPVNNAFYYYNGVNLVSVQHGSAPPLAQMNDTYNLIGRSLYDVDPGLYANIHEFRIYNGVLPLSQIALDDAAGPGNIITNPGPVQAVHLSSPFNPLLVNQSAVELFTGDFTNVTGLNLIDYGGATFVSGNAAVLTVNTNGVVKGVSPGTTTVVASYGGLKATNTLTVFALPATLTHRYSFAHDASDSVGGANGTLMGDATANNGLILDGVGNGSSATYVSLPGNLININTNSAASFEAWVTFGNPQTWAYLFGFGNTNNGGGVGQIGCVPCADGGGFHNWGITENFSGGQTVSWAHGWNNFTSHITCVVDPPSGTCSIYRDGVLQIAQYNFTAPLSNVPTNYAFIGRSFYDADPCLIATISEFRIYSGALTPWQVALLHQGGTNSTNLNVGALSSIVVVPTNYPANASLVAPVILANYANLANFSLIPMVQANQNANLGGPQGLVVTSSDPTIISVNSGAQANLLTTFRPGKVTLTASFGGKTNSATVYVRNEAVLTHRYSFNATGTANDSVGTANGTLQGSATIQQGSGGLQLDGVDSDYLALPGGLLSNYTAVTVDAWVSLGAPNHWARLWEFADTGAANQNEFYFAPGWNGTPNANDYSAGFPWGVTVTPLGALGNANYHITCTYGDGTLDVYTNGVLEAGATNSVAPASAAGYVFAGIGHSPYADPGINGSVGEFRIYQGRLSSQEIQASDALGPDQTLSTASPSLSASASAAMVTLSWPVANGGFWVQASPSLTSPNWTTITNVPALAGGTKWQVAVPKSSAAQFFRLWR